MNDLYGLLCMFLIFCAFALFIHATFKPERHPDESPERTRLARDLLMLMGCFGFGFIPIAAGIGYAFLLFLRQVGLAQ